MTVNEHKSPTLTSLLYWNEIKVHLFLFLFLYGRRFVSSSHPKSRLKARKLPFYFHFQFLFKVVFKPSWRRKTWIRPLLCFSLFCVQVRVGFEPTTADKTNKMKLQSKQLKCPIRREKSWKLHSRLDLEIRVSVMFSCNIPRLHVFYFSVTLKISWFNVHSWEVEE